jgi:hypothetical protein
MRPSPPNASLLLLPLLYGHSAVECKSFFFLKASFAIERGVGVHRAGIIFNTVPPSTEPLARRIGACDGGFSKVRVPIAQALARPRIGIYRSRPGIIYNTVPPPMGAQARTPYRCL